MPHRRPIEFWRDIRALVEKGLSLKKASRQFKVSFSHLRERAVAEGWKLCWRGRPRTLDYVNEERRAEMANEQAQRDARQAKLLLEARVAVFDTKKAELVAQKILAQHSTEMKVRLSELVVQTAEDLRSPEVRPKDRASAMVALKTVSNQLYGWDREPDIQRMELARTSDQTRVVSYYQHWLQGTTPPPVTGAVNLALIATTPEQLKAMAEAEENRDCQRGASTTERNGQEMGPSAITPEQPGAATHGHPIPKKGAPQPPPDGQSAKGATAGNPPVLEKPQQPSDGFERIAHPAPLSPQHTPKHPAEQTSRQEPPPTPGSPAWHRLRIEELDRLRAEWRRWR